MKRWILLLAALLLLLSACEKAPPEVEPVQASYTQISQEEAKERMAREDGHLLLDVRRRDEYDQGHIPGAVCLPNETIGETAPAELPDKDQVLLIYCRSGNRSKQAAQKLADLGYTNVYEFGGILDWDGDVVTDEPADAPEPATLVLSSFSGGGPEYDVTVADPALVSVSSSREYPQGAEDLDGASYDVIYSFTGLRPGETTVTLTARSPIAENYDAEYRLTVGEDLTVTLAQTAYHDLDEVTE